MILKEFNESVYYAEADISNLKAEDIGFLKLKAKGNKNRSVRLCMHKDIRDRIHEMLIVHARDKYVRPHKHLNKAESLFVVEGAADAIFYDEDESIVEVIPLGDYSSGKRFYYRVWRPIYHNLIIKTDYFVFHEVTEGPFDRSKTVFAPWSPQEDDISGIMRFTESVTKTAMSFLV